MGRSLLRWGIVFGVVGWLGPGFGAPGFGQATVSAPPATPSGLAAAVPSNLAETGRAMSGNLRQLERSIPDSSVVVLRRNNSDNRLEAATPAGPRDPSWLAAWRAADDAADGMITKTLGEQMIASRELPPLLPL